MQHSGSDKPLSRAPYSAIAPIYDQMMSHVAYRRWARYIRRLLEQEDFLKRGPLLDIGCGTGRFLQELQRLGVGGSGCEPAMAMLNLAGKRLPDMHFYHTGLPELRKIPEGRFHIMSCLYDTMNYLEDSAALIASLQTIYRKLASPGLFIFDIVSPLHCRDHFQNYVDSEVVDDNYAYYRESFFDADNNIQHNMIRLYAENGIYEECHRQKIFEFTEVREMIRQNSDFMLLHCYDDFTRSEADENSGRAHFVLRKNAGKNS